MPPDEFKSLRDRRLCQGLPDGLGVAADALVASRRRGLRPAESRARRTSRRVHKPSQLRDAEILRPQRRVRHTASDMFDLVADVERYPEFVPLLQRAQDAAAAGNAEGVVTIVADMTVAYKLIRETFRSRVTLDRANLQILVEYLEGPFSRMQNRWEFHAGARTSSATSKFFISYEFRSRMLGMLMGTMFDTAFRPLLERLREARRRRLWTRKNAPKQASSSRGGCARFALGQIVQHPERLQYRLFADCRPRPISPNRFSACDEASGARRHGEMHEADRLFRRTTVRPGNARHRYSDIDRRVGDAAARHLFRGFAADGAILVQRCRRYADHVLFGLIGVGDEAALEHAGNARALRPSVPATMPAGAGSPPSQASGSCACRYPSRRLRRLNDVVIQHGQPNSQAGGWLPSHRRRCLRGGR